MSTRAVPSATSLEQVLEIVGRNDRASGFHHNFADGTGRMISVEAPASGMVALEVTAPHAHANHLIRPAFSGVGQTVSDSSRERQTRADTMLRAGERDALTILFDRTVQEFPILCRGEQDASDSYTLATFSCTFGAASMEWAVHHGPDRTPVARGVSA